MRQLSLLLAASVMAVGLAVSGGASAEDKPSNYEVLTQGEILMKSAYKNGHVFTVIYDRAIFTCEVRRRGIYDDPPYNATTTCKTDYFD